MLLVAYTDMVVVVVPELTAWGQQVLYTHYPGSLGGARPLPHPTPPTQYFNFWGFGGRGLHPPFCVAAPADSLSIRMGQYSNYTVTTGMNGTQITVKGIKSIFFLSAHHVTTSLWKAQL